MPQSSIKLPLFTIKVEQKGQIHDVKDCVVRVDGLKHCMVGEIVELGGGMLGMIMEFDATGAMAVALGDTSFLRSCWGGMSGTDV
jgi:F0F1-type ATP synthase alpha subunit